MRIDETYVRLHTLPTPIEDQGICFFFDRYVLDWRLAPAHRLTPHRGVLHTTLISLGIAALANMYQNQNLLQWGLRTYNLALQKARDTLLNDVLSKRTSMLWAVVFLGLFEVRIQVFKNQAFTNRLLIKDYRLSRSFIVTNLGSAHRRRCSTIEPAKHRTVQRTAWGKDFSPVVFLHCRFNPAKL